MSELLKPFDAEAKCGKCGSEDIWVAWMPATPDYKLMECSQHHKERIIGEHHHRGCRCCGWHWCEGCLDAQEVTS